jgi:hypothetical protein
VTFSILDFDPVWSDMKHPVKVWSTSKISFNRYIDDAKYRYHFLLSSDLGLCIKNHTTTKKIILDCSKIL